METISSNLFHRDVVIEILSRLPVKSLMRFKCVCKSWYALVKDPYFISKHFKDYNDDKTRLLTYGHDDGRINLFIGKTFLDLSWIYLDHHMFNIQQIKGPFNGIFCLFQNHKSIILWNPEIREIRKLRNCLPSSNNFSFKKCRYNVGFGLDIVCNDYKLVLICSSVEEDHHEYLDAWLYNLRFDFWTQIDEIVNKLRRGYCLLKRQDSTYLNGVCYWLATKRDHGNMQRVCVLSFDLSNEVFEEIQGAPLNDYNESSDKFVLGLYHECLCLMVWDCSCLDLWVLKEKERYWRKELRVGGGVEGLFGKNNGDVLLQSGLLNYLMLQQNPNTNKLRDFDFVNYANGFHRYKESLLTIKLDDHGFEIPWYLLGI